MADNLDPSNLAQELAQFHIFQGLSLSELQLLEVRKPAQPLRPGLTLFRQGDIVPWVYFILKGEVELVRRERGRPPLRRIVRAGQVLGRLELDAKEGQLGAAKTLSEVELLAVSLESLARLRARYPHMESLFDRSDVIGQLRATPYLAPLTDIEITWISDIVEVLWAEPDAVLVEQGANIPDLFIIRQGRIRLDWEEHPRWVSAGAVFGYRDILAQRPARFTATAETKIRYLKLPREDFLAVIGRHPNQDWSHPPFSVETLLRRTTLFQTLNQELCCRLAGYVMQVHFHRAHKTIVQAGQESQYFYILARGAALRQSIGQNGQLVSVTIGPSTHFGTASLLFREAARDTVETIEPTDWIRIHHEDFFLFLHDHPEAEEQLNLSQAQRQRLQQFRQLEAWQHADERVLFKSRRHWIVLAKRMMVLIPLIGLQIGIIALYASLTHHWPSLWTQLLIALLYLLPLGAWILIDYLNDYHIVTNKRIIHREKLLLIRDRTLSAPIDQIQNLDIRRNLIAQFFRYGDLIISTAATEGQIIFDYLPNPSEAHHIISAEMQRIKVFSQVDDREARQKELQARLHIGLEEKIDERALIETPPKRQRKRSTALPFIRLLGLREEENNRLVWRRHWIGLIRITVPAFIATLLSSLFFVMIATNDIFESFPPAVRILFMILAAFMTLSSMFWLWWNWEDWENDRYIVSEQLIERISKKPLWFDEIRTTIGLERVQNVEYIRPNPLAYLLDYGNVDIQTAAQEGKITFEYVPAPADVQFEILNRMQNYQRNLERKRLENQKREVIEWLEAYHQLVAQERGFHSRTS